MLYPSCISFCGKGLVVHNHKHTCLLYPRTNDCLLENCYDCILSIADIFRYFKCKICVTDLTKVISHAR